MLLYTWMTYRRTIYRRLRLLEKLCLPRLRGANTTSVVWTEYAFLFKNLSKQILIRASIVKKAIAPVQSRN